MNAISPHVFFFLSHNADKGVKRAEEELSSLFQKQVSFIQRVKKEEEAGKLFPSQIKGGSHGGPFGSREKITLVLCALLFTYLFERPYLGVILR